MSGFGLLVLLLFIFTVGSIIMMYYNGNAELGLTKLLLGVLYLLALAELLLCVAEFPLYVVDGIIFASMGVEMLCRVMLIIYAAVIIFALVMILPKIKWRRFYTVSITKVIICGVLIIASLVYTELFNGMYSFEDKTEFRTVRDMYGEYNDSFLPLKLLQKETEDGTIVSVYPFDAHSAAGELDFVYRGEIFFALDDAGQTQMYFYPFTMDVALGKSDPVSFADPTYIPQSKLPPEVSQTDADAAGENGEGEAAQ